MAYGYCPGCDHKIDVGEDPDIGMNISCESCLADLVVAWLNPVELMSINYDDFDQFDDAELGDNFQKITRKKGDKNGSWKTQEKHQENHRYRKNY